MTATESDPFEWSWPGLESPHANQPDDVLEHVHVRNGDQPDELILIPADATDEQLATAWATAIGDSFVDLDDWR